jgi:hypothetical protein
LARGLGPAGGACPHAIVRGRGTCTPAPSAAAVGLFRRGKNVFPRLLPPGVLTGRAGRRGSGISTLFTFQRTTRRLRRRGTPRPRQRTSRAVIIISNHIISFNHNPRNCRPACFSAKPRAQWRERQEFKRRDRITTHGVRDQASGISVRSAGS